MQSKCVCSKQICSNILNGMRRLMYLWQVLYDGIYYLVDVDYFWSDIMKALCLEYNLSWVLLLEVSLFYFLSFQISMKKFQGQISCSKLTICIGAFSLCYLLFS